MYKGSGDSLGGRVDPSSIHHMKFTLVYTGGGESLGGVDPSSIHRMRFILVYRGCGESLEG